MENIVAIIVLVLIVILLISTGIKIYNRLVMLHSNTEKAYANIDVLLKQRADELPELLKIVKGYMKYEDGLLTKVVELRNAFLNTTKEEDKVKTYNALSSGLAKMMAVAENYPDLKATDSFMALRTRVSELEDHISDRRELFNESITNYNIGIKEFPAVLLSKPLGYREKTLLQISAAEKQYDGIEF